MSGYWFALSLCVVLIVILIQLLRKQRIREKYVALWLIVGVGVAVIGAFPAMTTRIARAVGVQLPINLLFTIGLFILLVVCIQLSIAVSRLEEQTRTLAEELALLRTETAPGAPAGARRGTGLPVGDETAPGAPAGALPQPQDTPPAADAVPADPVGACP